MSVEAFRKSFFDRAAVADKIPPAIKKALSKFGAFTRRRDKSSLKYRKAPAARGKPPSVHKSAHFKRKKKSKGVVTEQPTSPLRELIFFGFDPAKKSVVIGPAVFRSGTGGGGVAPAKIEEQHPHTLPAFQAELPKAADNFKNLIAR